MIGPNFVDEVDCGSFFDHIDDLLDFPADDSLPPPASDSDPFWSTHHSDSVFSAKCASDLSAELSVPYEDIVQLEWLSNFVEDSFSGGSLAMSNTEESSANRDASLGLFQTSSPVSVLESSLCSRDDKTGPRSPEALVTGRCGRARSKRPRPPTFSPRPTIASSTADTPLPKVYFDSENFVESHGLNKMPKQASKEQKKRKKIKLSIPLAPVDGNQNTQPQAVRKCLHCEITKTPQWRAGPMGPKTLCNACGVRYKSGRLYPEYRPAASPTFVPSVHSNSHKKVLEMRNKFGEMVDLAGHAITENNSPETVLIPNNNVLNLQMECM